MEFACSLHVCSPSQKAKKHACLVNFELPLGVSVCDGSATCPGCTAFPHRMSAGRKSNRLPPASAVYWCREGKMNEFMSHITGQYGD